MEAVDRGVVKVLTFEDKVSGPYCVVVQMAYVAVPLDWVVQKPIECPLVDAAGGDGANVYLLLTKRLPMSHLELTALDGEVVKHSDAGTDMLMAFKTGGLGEFEGGQLDHSINSVSESKMAAEHVGKSISAASLSSQLSSSSQLSRSSPSTPLRAASLLLNPRRSNSSVSRTSSFAIHLRAKSAKICRTWSQSFAKEKEKLENKSSKFVSDADIVEIQTFCREIMSAGAFDTASELLLSASVIIDQLCTCLDEYVIVLFSPKIIKIRLLFRFHSPC